MKLRHIFKGSQLGLRLILRSLPLKLTEECLFFRLLNKAISVPQGYEGLDLESDSELFQVVELLVVSSD
jgi:hypothetical protein